MQHIYVCTIYKHPACRISLLQAIYPSIPVRANITPDMTFYFRHLEHLFISLRSLPAFLEFAHLVSGSPSSHGRHSYIFVPTVCSRYSRLFLALPLTPVHTAPCSSITGGTQRGNRDCRERTKSSAVSSLASIAIVFSIPRLFPYSTASLQRKREPESVWCSDDN